MTIIEYDIKYNLILFIESLSLEEADHTNRIYKQIIEPNCLQNQIACQYIHIKRKSELFSILQEICDIENEVFPIIHIACHGNEDGIKLIDDFVKFEEIRELVTKINIKSRNHLYLIMAMCHGSFAIKLYAKLRAPFYCMFGPQRDISGSLLDQLLEHFYQNLMQTNDPITALQYTKSKNNDEPLPFQISTCMEMFELLNDITKELSQSGKGRHQLLNTFKEMHGKELPYELKSKLQYPEQIEKLYKKQIDDFKNKFFMIDLYPINKTRFENYNTWIHDV